MKNFDEILTRARELVAAELDRRLTEASLRLPHLCVHNHRQELDVRPMVEGSPNPTFNTIAYQHGQTIGLCMLGAQRSEDGHWVVTGSDQEDAKWSGTICEDPIDAQRCPYFDPTLNKERVLQGFAADLATPVWISEHMPELAALLWVLDTTTPPRLSWVQRLTLYFRKVVLEPIRPSVDPAQLLPGS